MGLFSGMSTATQGGRTPFYQPDANYLVDIEEVTFKSSENPQKRGYKFFKIAGTVVDTNADPALNTNPDSPQAVRPGQKVSQLITLKPMFKEGDDINDLAIADIKKFLEVAHDQCTKDGKDLPPLPEGVGQEADAQWEELVTKVAVHDTQPFRCRLGVTTALYTTKAGKAFTLHYYNSSDGYEIPKRG